MIRLARPVLKGLSDAGRAAINILLNLRVGRELVGADNHRSTLQINL
jgi:hypothetical protein